MGQGYRLTVRGMTVIEAVVGFTIALFSFAVLLSVFSSGSKHASQSRNRTVAILLANSIVAEIDAHTYGDPAPSSWAEDEERPVQIWIQGRPQAMVFHKKIDFSKGNGSFVGKSSEDQDIVSVTITWRENMGADRVASDDNKELYLEVPKWR